MENNPPLAPTPETPAWLSQAETPTPPPPRKRWRIITFILGVVIVVGAGAFLLFTPRTNCLTPADYSSLTDEGTPESVDPKTAFYSATFYFQDASSKFNVNTATEQVGTIERISKFYIAHRHKPMTITLSVMNGLDSTNLASDRLDYITSLFTEQGVPASALTKDIINYEPSSEEEIPETLNMVGLSLVSAGTCE